MHKLLRTNDGNRREKFLLLSAVMASRYYWRLKYLATVHKHIPNIHICPKRCIIAAAYHFWQCCGSDGSTQSPHVKLGQHPETDENSQLIVSLKVTARSVGLSILQSLSKIR